MALAAVCILGGVLAVAIIRYEAEPASVAEPSASDSSPVLSGGAGTDQPGGRGVDTTAPEVAPPVITADPTLESTPTGYRLVSGPEGVQVAIPADWIVSPGAVPSNLQADSPVADRLIRFGGSTATAIPLLDTVAANETDNSNIANGYERLRLDHVPGLGDEAVDWEFVFTKDGVDRHSYGRYWRTNGIDYVVYASSSVDQWPAMAEVVDIMVRSAQPA